MSVDVRLPFGTFCRKSLAEYKRECGGNWSPAMIEGAIDRCLAAWNKARAPRKPAKVVSGEAEAIYALYPKKIARQAALRAILKALEKIPADVLAERVRNYAGVAARYSEEDRVYVPHAATWFNEGRYDDDPKEWLRPHMKAEGGAAGPAPLTEPPGWLAFMQREFPDWVRLDPSRGPVPKWAGGGGLSVDERKMVLEKMGRGRE